MPRSNFHLIHWSRSRCVFVEDDHFLDEMRRDEQDAVAIAEDDVARHHDGVADAYGTLMPLSTALVSEPGWAPR